MAFIKILVFDLGGVLFADGTAILESKSLPGEMTYKNILRSKECKMLRKGMITYSDFILWLSTVLPSEISPKSFVYEWFNSYTLDESLFNLIKQLRKRYYLVAFSGNIYERIEFLDKKYKFRELFDQEIYSYKYKINKDDPEFYKKLLEIVPCNPSECLFVDDHFTFLEKAATFGIKTFQYSGYDSFNKYIERQRLIAFDSFISVREGDSSIPMFSNQLVGMYWVNIDHLWFRGFRLRPPREIAVTLKGDFQNITPCCKDMSESLKNEKFHNTPIWISNEQNRLLVYEGRHRIIAAKMAGRKFILAKLIDQEHPKVLDQKNPNTKRYYGKNIISMNDFYTHHINSFIS